MNIDTLARRARVFVAVLAASFAWTCFAQPTITSNPQDLTVNVGDTATFSVSATGSGPLSYQWRKNGNDITGANASSFTITNIQTSDAAGYYCQVTDNNGPNWSGTATLTVNDPGTAPKVTDQTWDQTVNVGDSVTFSVTATGTAPLAYQWRKNGNDIPGANSSAYTISNVQTSDGAGYYCAVTNSYGADWSGTATLTVNNTGTAPKVTDQTWDQTVNVGDSVTFSVTATGTAPLAYQWRKDGNDIAGANSSSYTISNVQTSDAAGYYCAVTNSYGADWSGTAHLTVNSATAPKVTDQTWDQAVNVGGTATFSVTATGTAPLAYQWRKNGNDIAGANSASFTISNAQLSDDAGYYCAVTNSYGADWSGTAHLTVNGGNAPTITAQPQSQTVNVGASTTFSVTATGATPLSYQWRKDGTNINNATNSSYTIASTQTTDAGNFDVVVTNAYGSQTSAVATLTVSNNPSAPVITAQPQNTTVPPGGTATFSVTANGNPTPTYQWRKNSTNIANATNASLTLTNVQSADAGTYDVVVSNSAGSVTSNPATLTVSAGSGTLSIIEHPRSQRLTTGKNVVFTVTASGSGTLSYQWRKGTANIAGANSASLFLNGVQPADAADYYVTVSDSSGSATSVPATLAVDPAPPSGSQPVIMEVHTAAPKVLVVVLQTPVTYVKQGRATADDLSGYLSLNQWAVNGVQPAAIHRYSIPWDELPAMLWNDVPGVTPDSSNPNAYPVTTRHRIYLVLNDALQDNTTYHLTTPLGATDITFNSTTTPCESIKVNQVGYNKTSTVRYANFGVFMGDGGTLALDQTPSYQVINESTGQPVFPALQAASDLGDDTGMSNRNSGEHVYRLNLAGVPEGGPYYVYVVGAGRSRSFNVGGVSSQYISYVTMRGLYHQRCGMALESAYTEWTHDLCHPQVAYWLRSTVPSGIDDVDVTKGPGPADMAPMSGGYHDAADMDHNSAHPQISIDLLSFYEAFGPQLNNVKFRLPNESGINVPDLLEEILWSVKVWQRLQVRDADSRFGDFNDLQGGVMAGWSTNHYTAYGMDDAVHDPNAYGTYAVRLDTTAYCAGLFAQTSRLLRPYDPATADTLLDQARQAWGYIDRHGGFSAINAPFMYAALQLFLAVPADDPNVSTYHDIFKNQAHYLIQVGKNPDGSNLPEGVGFDPGNLYYDGQIPHFVSYLLSNRTDLDTSLKSDLTNRILSDANSGTSFAALPTATTYPLGVDQGGMGWGAGVSQGRYAATMIYAYALNTDPGMRQQYLNDISLYADYSLGLNPMGLSYYSGLGADQPNSPMHCNSYYTKYGVQHDGSPGYLDAAGNPIGNVPGILVYGPTGEGTLRYDTTLQQWVNNFGVYEYPIADKVVPAWDNLPPQRRYAHGWSMAHVNEFTTHQTITWNALMYAFLATH